MGFSFGFGRTKDDKQGILSEREIQERLYGRFLTLPGGANPKNKTGKNGGLSAHTPTAPAKPAPAKPFVQPSLFQHTQASEIPTAVVSRAVLEVVEPNKVSTDTAAIKKEPPVSLSRSPVFAAKPAKEASALQKNVSVSRLPVSPLLEKDDRPNFQLEMEEWKEKLRHISPLYFLILGAVVIGAIILFNIFVNNAVGKTPAESLRARGSAAHKYTSVREVSMTPALPIEKIEPADSVGSAASAPKKVIASDTPVSGDASSAVSIAPPIAKPVQPFYTIQICIYENEADVKTLIADLKEKGYADINYDKSVSGSGRTHYRVYYGKLENFKEAQDKMASFRKDPLFKKFPDSFIRTVK